MVCRAGPQHGYLLIDLILVAEFATAGWIAPLDARFPPGARGDYLAAPLAAAGYRGKLYAVPRFSEPGLLYFRQDLVPATPRTWGKLREIARAARRPELAGYVFQGKPYEGLVVNFLELLWSAGKEDFGRDGSVTANDGAGVVALTLLVDLLKTGIAPRGPLTYMERENLQEFLDRRSYRLSPRKGPGPGVLSLGVSVAGEELDGYPVLQHIGLAQGDQVKPMASACRTAALSASRRAVSTACSE